MTTTERTEARCAFAGCQAGGVILEGAQRVTAACLEYHPGCWAAVQHACAVAQDRIIARYAEAMA